MGYSICAENTLEYILEDTDLIAKMDKIQKRIKEMQSRVLRLYDESIEIEGQKIVWFHKVKNELGIPEDLEIDYDHINRKIIVKKGKLNA